MRERIIIRRKDTGLATALGLTALGLILGVARASIGGGFSIGPPESDFRLMGALSIGYRESVRSVLPDYAAKYAGANTGEGEIFGSISLFDGEVIGLLAGVSDRTVPWANLSLDSVPKVYVK